MLEAHPGDGGESPVQVQASSVSMGPPLGKSQDAEPDVKPRSLGSTFEASGDLGYASPVAVEASAGPGARSVKRERDGTGKGGLPELQKGWFSRQGRVATPPRRWRMMTTAMRKTRERRGRGRVWWETRLQRSELGCRPSFDPWNCLSTWCLAHHALSNTPVHCHNSHRS